MSAFWWVSASRIRHADEPLIVLNPSDRKRVWPRCSAPDLISVKSSSSQGAPPSRLLRLSRRSNNWISGGARNKALFEYHSGMLPIVRCTDLGLGIGTRRTEMIPLQCVLGGGADETIDGVPHYGAVSR